MNYNYKPPSRFDRKKELKQFGTHIFYGEGIKTEPKYVENMKEILKKRYKMNPASEIIIINNQSGGRNTLGLVEYAEKDVKFKIKSGENIDHVWIFYDKDSFKQDAFDNTYHKIISKNKKEYLNADGDCSDKNYTRWHALWSNECFELWVLLHFKYVDAALSRKDYIPSINAEFHKMKTSLTYEKNLDNLFEILEKYGNIKHAVKRAKKLDDGLMNSNKKTNPSTGIYTLIEYFKRYLKLDL